MTNADRIRTAGDEELVQYLIDRADVVRTGNGAQAWIGNFCGVAATEKEAEERELVWLRSEVQEGA